MASYPPVSEPHGQQSPHAGLERVEPETDPEILPPRDGQYGLPASMPPQLRRKQRPLWAVAPATYVLVGINCAVYIAMVARGVSFWMPNLDQLMSWGANNAGSVLINGEWWRVVTAMFVHVGIIHLATNMWCLWNLGLLAEPLMGSTGLLAVYLLTGGAGNLASIFWSWTHPLHDAAGALFYQAGAGASGAVFGIAGALIVLLKSRRLPVPPEELKRLRKSVIYFAGLNLLIGFSVNFGASYTGVYVDNSAHMGGFATGLLFAAPMVPRIGSPRTTFNLRLRAAIGGLVGLLVLFAFFLVRLSAQN